MTFGCRKARSYAHGRWATPPRAHRSPPLPSPPHPLNRIPRSQCGRLPPTRRTGRSASGSSDSWRMRLDKSEYCNALHTLHIKKQQQQISYCGGFIENQAWNELKKSNSSNKKKEKKKRKLWEGTEITGTVSEC